MEEGATGNCYAFRSPDLQDSFVMAFSNARIYTTWQQVRTGGDFNKYI
jgi:hypothetical protein